MQTDREQERMVRELDDESLIEPIEPKTDVLLFCPFCGGKSQCTEGAYDENEPSVMLFAVGCGGCLIFTPWQTDKQIAIARWNIRAAAGKYQEEV